MIFKNLSKSPATASVPRWQENLVEKIGVDYEAAAMQADNSFKKLFDERIAKCEPGYYAKVAFQCMEETPRYCFMKEMKEDGSIYDITIDLLLHTVSFNEI